MTEERSMCWVCGQWPTLTKGGLLRVHNYPPGPTDDSPGSIRFDPALIGRCPGSGRSATIRQQSLPLEDVA